MLKIAVCLSGQPRSVDYSYKSILSYFNNPTHTYDYFCHSWDYNTWKLQDKSISKAEYINLDILKQSLKLFSPKSNVIQTHKDLKKSNAGKNIRYGSLAYSFMMANHLKREYEYANNFKYDYVVKARYDSVFRPNTIFNCNTFIENKKIYYPHLGRIPYEYNKLNASDCIFYGDSWGMDIICDFYRYLKEVIDKKYVVDDPDIIGPGTTMYEYAALNNVHLVQCTHHLQEIFYRKEAIGLDVITEFDKIHDIHCSFYRNLNNG
jgi:hypothetical protein